MEKLQKDTHIPYYLQIKDIIKKRIADYCYPPGAPLPSEHKLSLEFEVTRTTIRKALEELKREGKIQTERGKGSVVSHPKIEQSLLRFYSFGRGVGLSGFSATSKMIEIKQIPCPPFVAQTLTWEKKQLPSDYAKNSGSEPRTESAYFSQVYSIARLRFVQETPLILEFSYVPVSLVPHLENHELAEKSLYDLMESEYKIHIGRAKEYLQPKTANDYEANMLDIDPGAAVFQTERITFDTKDRIIEIRRSTIRGDKFLFTTELF